MRADLLEVRIIDVANDGASEGDLGVLRVLVGPRPRRQVEACEVGPGAMGVGPMARAIGMETMINQAFDEAFVQWLTGKPSQPMWEPYVGPWELDNPWEARELPRVPIVLESGVTCLP